MKNENLKISILMPVYNASEYIDDCIDSILLQTEDNWELICVDDFSDDGTLEYLEFYEEMDPRIQVLRNKEKGIIPALNMAYQNATGKLITRMDSDDLMHHDKLRLLKNKLLKSGENHCVTALVNYFPEEKVMDGFVAYEKWLNALTSKQANFTEIYRECVIPSPCWMMYKSDLINCGGICGNQYPEDYDLVFRLYQAGIGIIGIKRVLHFWRDHPLRASRTNPHYSDQSFLDLKIPYFLKLDRDPSKKLILWGAGTKAKSLAKILIELNEDFEWVTNNPRKWDVNIYGKPIMATNETTLNQDCQYLISISSPTDKAEIELFFEKKMMTKNQDYFMLY